MKVIKTHPLKDEITVDIGPLLKGFATFLATGKPNIGAFITGFMIGRKFRRR